MHRFAKPGRYVRVLLMSIIVLALMIGLPDSDAGTATIVLLEAWMLAMVVETTSAPYKLQLNVFAGLIGVLAATFALWGKVPTWLSVGMGGILVALTLATLLRGAVRTIRRDGVTIQLVSAGLTIYVILGILFAMLIGFVAETTTGYYFMQGTDGDTSERVYFSFVTLTTTGYGDFTPGQQFGRALAVCEVLIGEIYLLTVVSLLVGNLRPGGPLTPEQGHLATMGGAADTSPAAGTDAPHPPPA